MPRRLVKSNDQKLFGVAGGIAEYLKVDSTIVRVGLVVGCFLCFFVGLGYLVAAMLMPSRVASGSAGTGNNTVDAPVDAPGEPELTSEGYRNQERRNWFGWALVGVGVLIGAANLGWFPVSGWIIFALVLIGAGVVFLAGRRRDGR
jgi:phage shock protein PspC (stress-responsive transcriptional regulator)